MQKAALYTCGAIFAVATVFHLVRLATDIQIVIGGIVIPVWASVPAAIITAVLTIWMVVAARQP